jgi:hypothetical protein
VVAVVVKVRMVPRRAHPNTPFLTKE